MSATTIAQKVSAEHLARTAYLYVRQSTLRQVRDNTESTERQYALRQRAVQLGWQSEQIVVIDSDQGQSGATAWLRSSLSNRWISSLNGSSVDDRSATLNTGGSSDRNAARIVFRANPARRINSRSAHQILDRNAPHEMLPPATPPSAPPQARLPPGLDQHDQARLTITPDTSATIQGGSNLNRQRGVSFSPAPTLSAPRLGPL